VEPFTHAALVSLQTSGVHPRNRWQLYVAKLPLACDRWSAARGHFLSYD